MNVLLFGFLLHSVHCEDFSVSLPQQLEAVRGSCLTIPCSFTVRDNYNKQLHSGCRAEWRDANNVQTTVEFTRPTTGDLTQKNCTTTVYDITEQQGRRVWFRLDCDNPLKWTFTDKTLNITVNVPPTPTLTPPTVSVSEGQSVSVQCSVPVPCLSPTPTLIWSPVLGHIQETLQEQPDKTYVKVSTLNFTVSDPETSLSCSAVHSRVDGTTVSSAVATAQVMCPQCHKFSVSLPPNIKALQGSCVTIPCSFQVENKYKTNLDSGCKVVWRDITENTLLNTRQTGDITQNSCSTTFHDIGHQHNQTYFFRVECDNLLKYTFREAGVNLQVTEAPPTPTLTPPTVSVSEGQSVSVQCSAPVPCLSPTPTLTWSPVLGHIQETLQKQPDKTYVKVSTLNFTACPLHHKTNLSCSAVYSREDGTHVLSPSAQITLDITYQPRNTRVTVSPSGPVTEHSNMSLSCSSDANPAVQHYHWYKADGGTHTLIGNSSVLNMKASRDTTAIFCEAQNELGTDNSTVTDLDVQFPAQILSSSNCPGDSARMSCVCETEGNPFPLIQWSLPEISSNHSISSEPLSDKALRSVITVIKPQWRDPVTLVCHSSNSLGSQKQRFSALAVLYRPLNTRVTVSPSGPVTEHSNMSLSCSSDANPAVQHYHWYKADGGTHTLIGNSSVLNMKASRDTTAIFCEAQNELGTDNSTVIHLDVQFPAQILSSSNCSGDSAQMSCVCETEGNPFPLIQWSLPEISSNHSISSEPLSDKALRSVITVIKPQWRDPVTLVCHSSNSLGSQKRRHYTHEFQQAGAEIEVKSLLLISIIIILLALMCVLLYVIRTQNIRLKCRSDDVALNPIPLSNESQVETQMGFYASTNEMVPQAESNIYANANELRAEEQAKSSAPNCNKENIQASDSGQDNALYSIVNWKTRSKKKVQETAANTDPPCSSYLEEERSIVGDRGRFCVSEKLVECEYAQVKFKPKKQVQ
ncbi:B-cell receptor CD22-like isoform X2 [Periophthalmus magnuspinnatus]|uniref:B-cell receptor CD22-like isoform X2 n=1 Tax=Periophthalmus magnuspinnatus TaxID=409849 RepID=UPI002436C155|nr:B-cell receptor CD22-like isoform X2 [Periophthalmus magnuspinnatus]